MCVCAKQLKKVNEKQSKQTFSAMAAWISVLNNSQSIVVLKQKQKRKEMQKRQKFPLQRTSVLLIRHGALWARVQFAQMCVTSTASLIFVIYLSSALCFYWKYANLLRGKFSATARCICVGANVCAYVFEYFSVKSFTSRDYGNVMIFLIDISGDNQKLFMDGGKLKH